MPKIPLYLRVWKKNPEHPRWKKPALTWRQKMKQAMDWGLKNEPKIHYKMSRPFDVNAYKNRKLPITLDCSATVVALYKDAGRPDPTGGKAFSGGKGGDAEYTGTLRSHTPQRSNKANMRVGDFFVHGSGTGAHVTVVYKTGKTTNSILVFSHGQEAGPLITTLATQLQVHGNYYTMHDGGRLK